MLRFTCAARNTTAKSTTSGESASRIAYPSQLPAVQSLQCQPRWKSEIRRFAGPHRLQREIAGPHNTTSKKMLSLAHRMRSPAKPRLNSQYRQRPEKRQSAAWDHI
jgi:hypothetical protein